MKEVRSRAERRPAERERRAASPLLGEESFGNGKRRCAWSLVPDDEARRRKSAGIKILDAHSRKALFRE